MTRESVSFASSNRPAPVPVNLLTPAIFLLGFCLASTAFAQLNSRELVDCSGTIQPADSGASAVELDGDGGMSYHAEVDGTGYFRISRIAAGEYRSRVLDSSGNILDTSLVVVGYSMPMIVIRVSTHARPASQSLVPGTVSLAVLAHKVPSDARKEMELADKAAKKKDASAAIEHLRKAVTLDPQYLEAHNTLGMRYIQSNQNDLALAEFRKALQIDPHNPTLQSNVSAALLALHRPVEAETAARRAVDLDGASPRAHYLVGLSLVEQGNHSAEAEKQLRDATEKIPIAHLFLAQLFIDNGKVDDAAAELKTYLATGRQEGRENAQAWLKKLDQSRAAAAARPADGGPVLLTEKK